MQEPLPPSLGYASDPFVNIGRVNNRGCEVSLRATPVITRQVTWDMVLSGSTLKNEVVSLGNIAPFYNQTEVYPGYPLGSISRTATSARTRNKQQYRHGHRCSIRAIPTLHWLRTSRTRSRCLGG